MRSPLVRRNKRRPDAARLAEASDLAASVASRAHKERMSFRPRLRPRRRLRLPLAQTHTLGAARRANKKAGNATAADNNSTNNSAANNNNTNNNHLPRRPELPRQFENT